MKVMQGGSFALIFFCVLTVVAYLFWAFGPRTSDYLRPQALRYDTVAHEFTFVRSTPRGGVWAYWTTECRSDGGLEKSAHGDTEYEDRGLQPRRFEAGDLQACTGAGLDFTLSQRHAAKTPLSFVTFPPVFSEWRCPGVGGDCQLIDRHD